MASDKLYFSVVNGSRQTTKLLSNLIKAVMRAAGMPVQFRPRALRNPGATRFFQYGYTDAKIR